MNPVPARGPRAMLGTLAHDLLVVVAVLACASPARAAIDGADPGMQALRPAGSLGALHRNSPYPPSFDAAILRRLGVWPRQGARQHLTCGGRTAITVRADAGAAGVARQDVDRLVVPDDEASSPHTGFTLVRGVAPAGVRMTAFPRPARAGEPFVVAISHPETLWVRRVRVDAEAGMPWIAEQPVGESGMTRVTVEIPADALSDSVRIMVWIADAAWTRSIPLVRDQRALADVRIDELPQVIRRVAPEYPAAAKRAGLEGTVLVQVLVGRDGTVAQTRVVRSVRGLDEAAEAAARRWTFRPAQVAGRPVSTWVAIPVRFERPHEDDE